MILAPPAVYCYEQVRTKKHRGCAVEAAESSPRLAPYLDVAGTLQGAARLYRWNVELSGAVCEALHIVEVVLRNALDEKLCDCNAGQTNLVTGERHSSDWLVDPSVLLERIAGRDMPEANHRALLSTKARPHEHRRPVHELERAVDGVYPLRNGDAHPGPLINSGIAGQLANFRTVIGAIDQDLLPWFASVEKVGPILKEKPKPIKLG